MAKKSEKEKLPKEVTRTAWIIVVGALAPMLDSTMVNIAVNKLQTDLNTSLNMIQWAITGYILALAVAVPISGWLLDHFNGKKVFAWAIGAFGAFSALSGLSWNITSFITFRAIQGFSAGILVMLLTSLIMQIAPAGRLGELMAVVSTPMILGPILGPVIGGFIVQDLNWHWIFYVNIPVAIIAIILAVRFLPDFTPFNPSSTMDWLGTIFLAGASMGLIYGIMKGSENTSNFFNLQMIIFCALGLLMIVAYIIYNHLRHDNTVLPLRFFKNKHYAAANIGMFLAGIASNGPMLLLPLFFQNIKDFTAIGAALILIPQGLGMLIARPTIGRFIDKIGARPVVLVSIAISLLGTLPFIFVQADTNLVWLCAVLFVRGIGIGGLQMPMMTDVYIGVEKKDVPGAGIGNRIIQNIGSSFGTAVISSVVTSVATGAAAAHWTAKLAQLQAQHTILTPTVVQAAKASVEQGVMLDGYQMGFLVSCITLAVIAIPALFMTSKKTRATMAKKSQESSTVATTTTA